MICYRSPTWFSQKQMKYTVDIVSPFLRNLSLKVGNQTVRLLSNFSKVQIIVKDKNAKDDSALYQSIRCAGEVE